MTRRPTRGSTRDATGRVGRLVALLAIALITATATADEPPAPVAYTLNEAPRAEREAMKRLLAATMWSKRAVAAARLERYDGGESRRTLAKLLADPAWQVRAFATRSLGRRRVPAGSGWFADEDDPRVLRAALRYRYPVDVERLRRGIRTLARSRKLDDRMLAAELAACSGDAALAEEARSLSRTVILRMNRHEAGALSPRLAVLTGQDDLRRAHRWRRWLMRDGRAFDLSHGYAIPAEGERLPTSLIGALPPERFAALEGYLGTLGGRAIDLAVCLDCTASMYGELSAAQGGIDDLLLFVGDVSASLRFGLVAYRDRHDRFETKAWDFTDDLRTARERLWSLTAEGGGDSREAVHKAMKLAVTRLSWSEGRAHVLTIVGDAPPHVGFGANCVELARDGAEHGLITHTIQAEGKPVEHFDAIAAAGNGQCVSLLDDHRLLPEIVGLTVGEAFGAEFRELFSTYLELCR